MFWCCSLETSHPRPHPQSPKVCSILLCLSITHYQRNANQNLAFLNKLLFQDSIIQDRRSNRICHRNEECKDFCIWRSKWNNLLMEQNDIEEIFPWALLMIYQAWPNSFVLYGNIFKKTAFRSWEWWSMLGWHSLEFLWQITLNHLYPSPNFIFTGRYNMCNNKRSMLYCLSQLPLPLQRWKWILNHP